MKKLSLFAAAALACAAVMTGCTTVNDNNMGNAFDAVVKPAEFQTVVEAQENIVTADAQMNVLFGIFSWGVSEFSDRSFCTDDAGMSLLPDPVKMVKDAAVYKACQANNCDLILNAKYTVKITDYFVFKMINCQVEGYPAMVKGIKAL